MRERFDSAMILIGCYSIIWKTVSMKNVLAVVALSLFAASAGAAELSGALGATGQGGLTARVGIGFNWDKSWFESSTGRLTGYWDAGYTYWEAGDASGGAHSLSFAPVFAYEFGSGNVKPFIEAGIGVACSQALRQAIRILALLSTSKTVLVRVSRLARHRK